MSVNQEREKVIAKLEEMLNYFRHTPIKSKDSLTKINKQLDDIVDSLKYVPSEPTFGSLPTEIKTNILNYLCNAEGFVAASVSQEWKQILEKNLKQVDEIRLGKHCTGDNRWEDEACFMPEEFLKAAAIHKLDVQLVICHPLPVNKSWTAEFTGIMDTKLKLIAEGLASFSNLNFEGYCYCNSDVEEKHVQTILGTAPTILSHQFEGLVEELEKRGKIMDSLQITAIDLTSSNNFTLANYFLKKVKKLTLDEGENGRILDNEIFIKILLKIPTSSQLRHLTLGDFNYPSPQKYPDLPKDLADAVCKVPGVSLRNLHDNRERKTAKRLLKNIRRQNIRMKSFELSRDIDWRDVLSPGKLKKTLEKVDELKLMGNFTVAQVEVARSLPGVEANVNKVSKCSVQSCRDQGVFSRSILKKTC